MLLKRLMVLGLLITSASTSASALKFAPPSTSTCVTLTKNLSRGSSDSEVSTLQQFLVDAGYLKIKPSGLFSSITANAVKSFQLANGISPIGSVGPMTRAKVKEVSCGSDSKKSFIAQDKIGNLPQVATPTTQVPVKETSTPTSRSSLNPVINSRPVDNSPDAYITRNKKRSDDVSKILDAIWENPYSPNRKFLQSITNVSTEICKTTGGPCTGMIDLGTLVLSRGHLSEIPVDPFRTTNSTSSGSGYYINFKPNDNNGWEPSEEVVVVTAPLAEMGKLISGSVIIKK